MSGGVAGRRTETGAGLRFDPIFLEVPMADRERLILIASGPDQVGLVEKISDFIHQRNGNIEDGKMAVMAGEFAYMVLITGDAKELDGIAASSKELSSQTGLHILVRRPASRNTPQNALPYRLTASCMDHPGVVHRLSAALSLLGINIESMETKTYLAPVSGAPVFRMEAVISIPTPININALRTQLEKIENDENIDISLGILTNES